MNVTVTAWVIESAPQNDFIRIHLMSLMITALLKFIISLVGLAGNAVVLCLLGFRMQRNAFSVYIFNLAGADFVYLFFQMLLSMEYFIKDLNLISFRRFSFIMIFFPYTVGLSTLTAISTERCISVLQPVWYRCRRPKHMSSVICALIWALFLLLSILRTILEGFQLVETRIDLCIATWLIFLFVLLFGSSLVLLTRFLCGSGKMKLTRLYVTTGVTVLFFVLCGLPLGIIYFLLFHLSIPVHWDLQIKIPFMVSRVLSCVNSCANPIIYFFVGSYRQQQRQKRSLKLILQRALQDGPEEDGSQGCPPQESLEMSEIVSCPNSITM